MYNSIIVSGVAGCYKTTAITKFGTLFSNVKSVLFDFAEDCKKYKNFLQNDVSTRTLYATFKCQQFNEINNKKSDKIMVFDRSILDSTLYNLIHYEMENRRSEIEDVQWDGIMKRIEIYKLMKETLNFDNWTMLLVVPSQNSMKQVVENMKTRNNGIDILSLEYVKVQRQIFMEFYDYFKEYDKLNIYLYEMDLTFYEPDQNIKILINIINLLSGGICLHNCKILSNNQFRVGIDLTPVKTYNLKKGKFTYVTVNERIVLPPGLVGLIQSRSSWQQKYITSGVIDPSYCGELKVAVYPIQDFDILMGERFAQFIIVQNQNSTSFSNIMELAPGFDFGRATRGFGSTN